MQQHLSNLRWILLHWRITIIKRPLQQEHPEGSFLQLKRTIPPMGQNSVEHQSQLPSTCTHLIRQRLQQQLQRRPICQDRIRRCICRVHCCFIHPNYFLQFLSDHRLPKRTNWTLHCSDWNQPQPCLQVFHRNRYLQQSHCQCQPRLPVCHKCIRCFRLILDTIYNF